MLGIISRKPFLQVVAVAVLVLCAGCRGMRQQAAVYEGPPRELSKASLPMYRIEPPDVLIIEAVRATPRDEYRLRTGDQLGIVLNAADQVGFINGAYRIQSGGLIVFGGDYGAVKVSDISIRQAETTIQNHIRARILDAVVTVTIVEVGGMQEISGEHLVVQDGTVNLGTYGGVPVVGLTVAEAKAAIETHLSKFFEVPEVAVDVVAFNSKVYYVITQGAGLGDAVHRFPITGNETVLDAIAQISGFDQVSSSKDLWVARPGPHKSESDILPVDWERISKYGDVRTNYQLLPGDRVYVAQDNWVAFDTAIGKFTAPIERLMGFSLLGADTGTRFTGKVLQGGGDNRFQR